MSVVVATYNRCALLPALFDALAAQTLSPSFFEVVIVDDCSPDETQETIRRLRTHCPMPLITIRQEVNGGPARARNEGIRIARGSIIAITDDDCLPTPRWLEEMLRSFEDLDVVGTEGPIETDASRVTAWTHQVSNATPGAFFTANIAYRRDDLLAAGLFDEHYPHPADEDTDLGLRMLEWGQIVFNPRAIVYHPPIAVGLVRNAKKVRYCLSDVRFFLKHPTRIIRPYRRLWLYTVRNVIVGICKQQLSLTPLFRRDPKKYGGYFVFNVLRLYYTVLLIPQYRAKEYNERQLLRM